MVAGPLPVGDHPLNAPYSSYGATATESRCYPVSLMPCARFQDWYGTTAVEPELCRSQLSGMEAAIDDAR